MALVTICIPAFRAAKFLPHTIRSALNQSCKDIAVEVAIEPPGMEELEVCEPLLEDSRLRLRINDEVMGWDGNIKGMLHRIETPYFVILPHDDFLHERYIEILLAALKQRPDASVAYGDIQFMSGSGFQRRFQALQENPILDRLASFLAAGANAPPWRGVTRSSVLEGTAFPTDQFGGYRVECEWAYHLLTRGPALRVGQTLYFKRAFAGERETASIVREQAPIQTRLKALNEYRQRLASRTLAALGSSILPAIIECGLDAVIARSHLIMKLGADDPELRDRLLRAEHDCLKIQSELANKILSTIYLSQCDMADAAGDIETALRKAQMAVIADDFNPHAHMKLAHILRAKGDKFGALQAIARACDVDPYTMGAYNLGPKIEQEFITSVSSERGNSFK